MSHWESASKSDEWYTPPHIFGDLGETFDTDVAAPIAKTYVPAKSFITSNSLSSQVKWFGFVWMNPPFGKRNSISAWLDKFFAHGNGIALTPDRTSAPWFMGAWSKTDAVLFLPKVRFLRPDGTEGKAPSNGTALWASGERAEQALRRAARRKAGILAVPVRF